MSTCSVTQSCLTLCDTMTVAHQIPLSMGFSWQEYWSGSPFPAPIFFFWPRDQTHISYISRQILYHWVTWKSQYCKEIFLIIMRLNYILHTSTWCSLPSKLPWYAHISGKVCFIRFGGNFKILNWGISRYELYS